MANRRKHRHALWMRLRLTWAGWLFLSIAVLVGLAGGQSQAALVLVLFGVMISALMVSMVLAWRMVSAVRLRRDLPERAWQNQTVHLAYHLRNARWRGASLGLKVDEIAPEGIDSAGGYCVELPARAVFRAGARFAVRRRGRIRLKAIRVSTSFPFGLISASRSTKAAASLMIWPARGQLKRQLLYHGAAETSSAAPSGASGGKDEFFGLREYRDGDNPRWIHWRRSATKTTPVIREMARPLPEQLWVLLDTYHVDPGEIAWQRRERLLRFAATLIDHAFSRGYRVGLALAYSDGIKVLPPAEGRGQRCTLLDALAEVDDNIRIPLNQTLAKLNRRQLQQGQVIVVAPQTERLKSASLNLIRAACRHLTVVTERQLSEVFEDNPLAADEEYHAA